MFDNDDFDKSFKKVERMVYVGWFVSAAIAICGIAFFVWVVIKLLQFFGVV